MTKKLNEFIEWLEDQDYWVNKSEVDDKWPEIEFAESTGITMKENDDGETLIPKRDLKSLAIRGDN